MRGKYFDGVVGDELADWKPLSDEWQPLSDPGQLWFNTVLLALGSVCLQWARVVSRRVESVNLHSNVVIGFSLGGFFAIAFILGQLWLWKQFVDWGYFLSSNPANSFFYLLTGLHGLHLLGGLIAWSRTAFKLWRGRYPENIKSSVELCAIYWHYLLGLWLVLFLVLVSTPENYRVFAAFCGIEI